MDNIIYDSIKRYFNALSVDGYYNYTDVKRLVVLIFLNELLKTKYSSYLTDDDYKKIIKAIKCIDGTCLIPLLRSQDIIPAEINEYIDLASIQNPACVI